MQMAQRETKSAGQSKHKAKQRCIWAGDDPLMQEYHDEEWGGAAARSPCALGNADARGFPGRARMDYCAAKTCGFSYCVCRLRPDQSLCFNEKDVRRLLDNSGIIRSRAKIEATIKGARIFCEMADRGEDFAEFCWSFTGRKVIKGDGKSFPAQTSLSGQISMELKRRGFKFVGPTIVYAWMQAVGIVNDHAADCFRRKQVSSSQSKSV